MCSWVALFNIDSTRIYEASTKTPLGGPGTTGKCIIVCRTIDRSSVDMPSVRLHSA